MSLPLGMGSTAVFLSKSDVGAPILDAGDGLVNPESGRVANVNARESMAFVRIPRMG